MKTFAEFETWFNSELQKHPMIAKSNPLSLNELCYILRMSEFDFSVNWRTDDGFASIPSVREAFISSRTLALKIEIFGYHEDISCGEIYRSITVRIIGNRTSIPALNRGCPFVSLNGMKTETLATQQAICFLRRLVITSL